MSLPPELGAAAGGQRVYRRRREQRFGGIVDLEFAFCMKKLPTGGCKKVNLARLMHVEDVHDRFFACDEVWLRSLHGSNRDTPKTRRVSDNPGPL
jgi:hypothetical protein